MRWYGTDFQWGAFAGTAMQIVRVYTGTDGESHFEDIDVEFDQNGAFGRISKMVAAGDLDDFQGELAARVRPGTSVSKRL